MTREGEESQRDERETKEAQEHERSEEAQRGGASDLIRVRKVLTRAVAFYACSKHMKACKSGMEFIKKLKTL